MCGFLSIFGRVSAASRLHADAMIDAMADRGPDGRGRLERGPFLLGHRRLAIRDAAGGTQPMASPDGRHAVAYNGELYNDADLRAAITRETGWRFRTRCDTETVLAAYAAWGADCVKRFRGMFAFAAVDFDARTGLLARDPCGVKPLFFMAADGALVAASAVAALLRHPHAPKRPNFRAVSHYLSSFRGTLGRETLYEGVFQLRPGERLRWHEGDVTVDRYWRLPAEVRRRPFREAVEELRESVDEAVRVREVADRPLGMMLSGGVDSAAIAASLSRGGLEVSARSAGSEAAPASATAAKINAAGGRLDVTAVEPDAGTFRAAWDDLRERTRLPATTPSDPVILLLAKSLKRSADVALGGEGADELMYGYAAAHATAEDFDRFRPPVVRRRVDAAHPASEMLRPAARRWVDRDRSLALADHFLARNSLVSCGAKPALLSHEAWTAAEADEPVRGHYAAELAGSPGEPAARRVMRLMHGLNLEGQLARLDAATMRASLEARVPFTDVKLVERMATLPAAAQIRPAAAGGDFGGGDFGGGDFGYETKRVLRAVVRRSVSPEVAARPKRSFPTPVAGWLTGEWREEVRDTLTRSRFARTLFRADALCDLIVRPESHGMLLWPVVNLALWGDREFS